MCCSYGDRAPKSIPGRIFCIIWTLTGLVLISVLVGTIASSLTTAVVEKEVMLYGTEVSLINIHRKQKHSTAKKEELPNCLIFRSDLTEARWIEKGFVNSL